MSSISPASLWRGCAANFRQPVTEKDEHAAQFLVITVHYVNCFLNHPPLPRIVYRSGNREHDILHHVFRWDHTPYEEIFENGFRCRRKQHTPDDIYFSLKNYVDNGGGSLDTRDLTTSAFISTTVDTNWNPSFAPGTTIGYIYRYEIYAPGGISVAATFHQNYKYTANGEVCFVSGIAPQYIRSAQPYRLTTPANSRNSRRERLGNKLVVNGNFNPQSHPYRELSIQNPVKYFTEFRKGTDQSVVCYPAAAADWYVADVTRAESYIDAAFRSSSTNRAYLFMKNECVLVDYAPNSNDDKVEGDTFFISDGFPSLKGTAFGQCGIDCAFGASYGTSTAFIFSGNLCALIDYAPGTSDDKIIEGPRVISAMFRLLKGTVFESGIDAAFESTNKYEVYLFKDDQNARINYEGSGSITIRPIKEGFPGLTGTFFASGIDAAFASHKHNEAYIFKGDSYARINFSPGDYKDHIIGAVEKIKPIWPCLKYILPRKNHGLDSS